MSRRRKQLERIRRNPKNVSLEDLRHILENYGFTFRHATGSHYTFSYELEGATQLFVVPFKRPVKAVYVKRALKLIDLIIAEQEEEQDEDEPDDTETDDD